MKMLGENGALGGTISCLSPTLSVVHIESLKFQSIGSLHTVAYNRHPLIDVPMPHLYLGNIFLLYLVWFCSENRV